MKLRASVSAAAFLAIALLASTRAGAELCDACGCPVNQYCATPDGGHETVDGGACKPEPCVVSNDCTAGHLCYTAQEPHACVDCISTANCQGSKICDVPTHTCIAPPEAGAPDAGEDAGDDAAAPDASLPDSSAPDSSTVPPADAATPRDASHDATSVAAVDAGPDTGSLGGGACDCDTVGTTGSAGGLLASVLFAAAFAVRRRRRR